MHNIYRGNLDNVYVFNDEEELEKDLNKNKQ